MANTSKTKYAKTSNMSMSESMSELLVLNYVYQNNSMDIILQNGLTEDDFTTYRDHFKFLLDFYDREHAIPSHETIVGRFGGQFQWLEVTDSEDAILHMLKEAKLYRNSLDLYKSAGELMMNEQTDEAVKVLTELVHSYNMETQTPCVDLIADAKIRLDSYQDKVEHPTKNFIKTGLDELDETIGGWDVKNESAVICARTGYGKSWWLIYFALSAAMQGKTVGYYSGEMEPEIIGYRLDTFLGHIANGSLTHGNKDVSDSYTIYINSLAGEVSGHIYCITPDMVGGEMTVSKLRAFIEKYNIEILFIDQFSLLDDERHGRGIREQSVNISKDLRTLQRLKKIPIISAVQLNREDTSETGITTKNISESDRIGQDSTLVISLERKDKYTIVFSIIKARSAQTGTKLTYKWDINSGGIQYMPTENDAVKGEGADKLLSVFDDDLDSGECPF